MKAASQTLQRLDATQGSWARVFRTFFALVPTPAGGESVDVAALLSGAPTPLSDVAIKLFVEAAKDAPGLRQITAEVTWRSGADGATIRTQKRPRPSRSDRARTSWQPLVRRPSERRQCELGAQSDRRGPGNGDHPGWRDRRPCRPAGARRRTEHRDSRAHESAEGTADPAALSSSPDVHHVRRSLLPPRASDGEMSSRQSPSTRSQLTGGSCSEET